MRLPLYVYSTKNLAGCGLAIVTLALYFTGVIHDYWWELTAGAYGIGALLGPGSSRIDLEMQKQMTDAEIIAGLVAIAQRAPAMLPPAVARDVVAICETLTALLPAIARANVGVETAYDVRTAATEYLPRTLEAYFALPPAFRVIARSAQGKGADAMLAEQIDILRRRLDEIAVAVSSLDTAKLAENGQFLRDRFAQPDLRGAL